RDSHSGRREPLRGEVGRDDARRGQVRRGRARSTRERSRQNALDHQEEPRGPRGETSTAGGDLDVKISIAPLLKQPDGTHTDYETEDSPVDPRVDTRGLVDACVSSTRSALVSSLTTTTR